MQGLVASLLDALWRAPEAVVAALLLVLPALGLRALLRAALDRDAPFALQLARAIAGAAGLLAGVALAPVGWAALAHTRGPLIAASLAFALVLASAALPSLRERSAVAAGLLPIGLVVLLAGLSALALLRAGFLRGATGATLAIVEVTGESRREIVRFAPSGLPPREEGFRAERLVVSGDDGVGLGDAWVFGRAATLRGEALRLRTWGSGSWLARFELATNDAPSEEGRARLYPPQRTPVEPLGLGVVPGWWRDRQRTLLLALGLEPRPLVSPPLPLLDSHALAWRGAQRLIVEDDGTLVLVPARSPLTR